MFMPPMANNLLPTGPPRNVMINMAKRTTAIIIKTGKEQPEFFSSALYLLSRCSCYCSCFLHESNTI
jgi:hypothetical protein